MTPGHEPEAGGESTAEVRARERGEPFVTYRDGHGRRRVVSLLTSWDRATVGRSPDADVALVWDEHVSTIHAELTRLGEEWLLIDDGLSRNGSFINGERMHGRRRLRDGDRVTFGVTEVTFHAPMQVGQETVVGLERPADTDTRG